MGVNKSYIEFLLQLLNNEEKMDIEGNRETLIVNLYLTLLSLSNLECIDNVDLYEKETIEDFLRRLNNLKVKIQLKRKPEEINKFAEELINQYYENINILSIYIKDSLELENIINTKDTKGLTKLIDASTKDKIDKEYTEEDRKKRRMEIINLLGKNEYYVEDNKVFIKNDEKYEEVTFKDFINMFSYLLNPDSYIKIYNDENNQRSHELIITSIIKLLMTFDKKQDKLDKTLLPIILTYISSFDITKYYNLDTSEFNIENIKISELYSLAKKDDAKSNNSTPKWRNISIPNEYLLGKIKDMINRGMYYYNEDTFVLEHIENNISDFKISIKTEKIKEFLKTVLEAN